MYPPKIFQNYFRVGMNVRRYLHHEPFHRRCLSITKYDNFLSNRLLEGFRFPVCCQWCLKSSLKKVITEIKTQITLIILKQSSCWQGKCQLQNHLRKWLKPVANKTKPDRAPSFDTHQKFTQQGIKKEDQPEIKTIQHRLLQNQK